MNPSYLFSLSESKHALYRNQPDLAQGRQISEPEEYEHPPFVENAALRLWYNEQPDRYMTHWHNSTEMIVALENCYTVQYKTRFFIFNLVIFLSFPLVHCTPYKEIQKVKDLALSFYLS